MKNKKFIPLILLSTLMLGACSGEIVAKPTDYEDKLINVDKEIHHNINSIVYDAMRENGTVSKDVLNEVLLQIANSIYGDYATVKAKAATKDTAWLEAHTVYHDYDKDGKHVFNADNAQARLVKFAADLEDRIAVKMYDAISGNYLREGKFYEEDYVMSLVNNNEKLDFGEGVRPLDYKNYHNGYLVIPELDKEEVFTYKWEDATKKDGLLTRSIYNPYIEKKIVPEIFREVLVETYLFEESYNTLGRSFARKVNIVTISNRADDLLGANNLMNAYVDKYINGTKDDAVKGDFEIINKAWRGLGLHEDAANPLQGQYKLANGLLKDAGLVETVYSNSDDVISLTDAQKNYFKGTSYASIIKDLEKIKADPKATDTSVESSFTNSGAYTIKDGYNYKVNDIRKEDYTKDGWYVKADGLSDLDSSIRSQLFNVGVANALDNDKTIDRYNETTGEYKIPENESRYIAKIHGRYFLKTTFSQNKEDAEDKKNDILWFTNESKSYTIVEVEEAVNSSKLTRKTDDAKRYNDEKYNEVVGNVAKEVAKNESYKTLSTKYWLEKAAMEFHDEKILKYFEDTYPELFEDK